jgi:ABC-2 type transport system ATP-binding protein
MGKTILISSHILTELADCCTSIGIIERGKLLLHGPMDEVYRKLHGNQIVIARFGRNSETGLTIIRSNPQVRDVQAEGEEVTIEFTSPQHDAGALLKQLVLADVEVRSFAEKEPTLEDVFMLVTKGLVT